jgi:hypothetical protein
MEAKEALEREREILRRTKIYPIKKISTFSKHNEPGQSLIN